MHKSKTDGVIKNGYRVFLYMKTIALLNSMSFNYSFSGDSFDYFKINNQLITNGLNLSKAVVAPIQICEIATKRE
ncbi:MAG: hypothetical protein EAZ70_09475 [Runella slithyformis]|nr:MAG: hypothetical protein EAY79_10615 [Runella slithyformis]TAF92533.1 MAG: hypothetical protein EAZ46_13275 [Runella sp.]TAG25328.1 MAG: hypothetical protein EAZ38_00095 [Cytophagales bacterium]TAG42489.1 MAG: hypothetical protein EAZ32_01060 [Cytophagia bacterium]TAE92845.1 MAG: hypothetical protein EAZ80_11920 [Runella slithyformis]